VKRPPQESRFILGNSERMRDLAPDLLGKVALIITSPPYHNAIDYESHAIDSSVNYRTRSSRDYANEYLPMLQSVWAASWKMLKPGGYLVVNAGTHLDSGFHFPLPQDMIAAEVANHDQWEFIRTVVWFKVTAGVKRAGSVIQHPLPDYWSYNIMTEHIQVLRKPGGKSLVNENVPASWWQPVWDLAPVPPGQVDHPAPFPEDIPHRFIRMLTNEGDWVLDPFNGAGTTTKAAYDLKRSGIGFDISDKYIEIAKARISSHSTVRSSQLQIVAIPSGDFTPGKSRGQTRQGAGLAGRGSK
jgi:DNA modification methylase